MYTSRSSYRPKLAKHRPKSRRPLWAALFILLLGGLLGWMVFSPSDKTNVGRSSDNAGQAQPTLNKQLHSVTDPTSIWVIVNKPLALAPVSYTPSDLVTPNVPLRTSGEEMKLRQETAIALEKLVAAAKGEGYDLMLASGYRSYNFQVGLYNGYVKTQGQAEADKTSARPGHSEHQTGLALDIEPASRKCEVTVCFAATPEGQWVAAHAYEYGFIIRYTQDKVAVTGYEYEPWHLRYVGTDLSAELHKRGIETLEEFFEVKGGKEY